jgi:hypothetical protein
MRSSLLYADGKIYFCENNGRWYVLRPDPDEGVVTISKGRFPSGEECHASPICSHGKLYIQTTDAMYCLHDPAKQTGITARPPAPQELSPADDQTPAHVQVVPAEMLLEPGQQQKLTVYTYNARGQRLGEASAQFEVTGAGEIQDGVLTVPADAGHTATVVKASVGSLTTGLARIRIVPSLPWRFDFEGLSQPPITWVGARYRHVVRSVDGNSVMVKITTIPKGTRSRCWFGPSDVHDYTIEAEVLGAIQDNKTPDIGLIAQGYALDLQGASQRLQIRTWVPQERMARSVDFAWKPNQWYMMKLECSLQGDQAVLRGKVWPKGSEEPAQWTVEATDPSPNLTGSPGLYGNAKDAEILLDNIKVYSNSPH